MGTTVITGATGYIGRHLVARLVAEGQRPRCLIRDKARVNGLPTDRIEIVNGDITDAASLPTAMRGASSVVHMASVVAVVKETKTLRYKQINDAGTANVVKAAKDAGVRHFIHMGGLNTVPGTDGSYMRTRWNGEQHVKESGIPYTILQASILFGDSAAFFTALRDLAKTAPFVPVPGNGKLRFQPIWVEDVVTCITKLLAEEGRNEIIPLGGPEFYTYDAILDLIFKSIGKRRIKLHLPMPLIALGAGVMQTILPKPPLTTAALDLFASDNVTVLNAIPARFGFQPRSLATDMAEHGI